MKLYEGRAIFIALVGAAVLSACGEKDSTPSAASSTSSSPTPITAPTPDAAPTVSPAPETISATETAEATNPLDALPAPYNTADYDQGRRQFTKCRSCHLIEEGAGHRVGPNLHGVFDRKIGALEDFRYSKVVEAADFQWTPEQLDHWLANPKKFLPGNRMTFAGIANEDQRTNLIAYLLVETSK